MCEHVKFIRGSLYWVCENGYKLESIGGIMMKEKDKHSKCINCGHPIHFYMKKKIWLHDGSRFAYCQFRWSAKNPNHALLGGCNCNNAQPLIKEVL